MKSLLAAFLIWACYLPTADAQGVPTILLARSSEQQDTTGCNLVREVTKTLYREIMAGKLRIWDSQNKELSFSASTLQSLEKSAGIAFQEQENMFIYERWTQSKREVTTSTAGLYFAHKSERGTETVFGYVDYSDVVELFSKTKMASNASGNYSATLETVLKSKNFNYRLIQLGNQSIKTPSEGQDLLYAFVGNRVFNESTLGYYPPDKYITYLLDTYADGTDAQSLNGKRLLQLLGEYFIRNQEIYYNMGGDRITSHLNRNKFRVTKIEVNEIWRKVGSEILYEPKSILIYVNDSALNEINARNLADFEFRYGETDLFGFLRTREFNTIITKINSETIERKDAFIFLKALMTEEWNKLNQYVNEYE